jgi:hypothetical protein
MTLRPQHIWMPIAGLLVGMAGFTATCHVSAQGSKGPIGKSKSMGDHPARFTFSIPADAPLAELLPMPPESASAPPTPWNNDLAKVPEVAFGAPISHQSKNAKSQTAHILAKINHLNGKATDGFMTALLRERADLRGMPFLLGTDCRADKKQAQLFAAITDVIRSAMPNTSWDELSPQKIGVAILQAIPDFNKEDVAVEPVIVGALMQMITPGSKLYGPRLPKRLAAIAHPDAVRALVSLVLFSPDAKVRQAAIDGLQARRPVEYTDDLLSGFRYPLPMAAKRSADAFVKLGRKDIQAKLEEVLEQPDPRAPKPYRIDGKNYFVLRELVRVNHHRNCVLCHAPGNADDAPSENLRSEIPIANEPFRGPPGFYGFRKPSDIVVRIDMTYLRQDFSIDLPVKDSGPWPKEQRFDYFVRTRLISAEEAAECDRQLSKMPQPYHAVALQAVRTLTSPNFGAAPKVENTPPKHFSAGKSTTTQVASAKPATLTAHDSSSLVLAFVGIFCGLTASTTIALAFITRLL